MATLPTKPKEAVKETRSAKVEALFHKQRHPVTGILFNPGSPVDVIDLDAPDNAFVRHQIDAGVFKVL